ncbi:glycosyltransferase family 2 protein [Paenibacillus alginolyticus]|uniref:4,4'-diaponeurosporenoate glycosyltransferase n=1 Tax=Paenibacillus alginolyticus TaxID=59839 RepID=A0ABT4GLV9_9BACL|nr:MULTISPECIES: glycosyltransferase [Paenibacillus]MCY9697071.1 glycosyltransferase [Paenibacillus alginolyticus]MEC0146438.1 glycosyltransferase [Paenibacillus alginolyticus]NRF91953.1 glycosyltransferase [Paenibacillus frigoriresistens]
MIISTIVWLSGLMCGAWLLGKILPLEGNYRMSLSIGHNPNLPRISVIIPARNEERNLAVLLPSIKGQPISDLEVIVVDDGSTDRTAAVALSYGARIVTPGELPLGWVGKCWASWHGARAASGDLLIFLDADTCIEPGGLLKLAEAGLELNGLLSIQPYHIMKRPYESLSAFFNIVVLAAVANPKPTKHNRNRSTGAFGPCIVCTREAYFESGGHETIRHHILENHSLGRLFARQQQPVHNRTGEGVLTFRMYPEGFGQLISGWSKSFASGASSTTPLRLLAIIWWMTGAVTVVTQSMDSQMWSLPLAIVLGCTSYTAYALLLYALLKRAGNFSMLTAIFFPIPLLAFMGIFASSVLQTFFKREVTWKGRSISTSKGREEP